jgi:hypothetical protein
MATAIVTPRETVPSKNAPSARRASETSSNTIDHAAATRNATDDEILGLRETTDAAAAGRKQLEFDWDAVDPNVDHAKKSEGDQEQGLRSSRERELNAVLDANPDLRRAWDESIAYHETFSTPQEARTAKTRLVDLDRMDALFFSRRPEDHSELARAVAALDPSAFNSLAQAMAQLASGGRTDGGNGVSAPGSHAVVAQVPSATESSISPRQLQTDGGSARVSTPPSADPNGSRASSSASSDGRTFTPSEADFFHSANATAVEEVLGAIESQVERLLPEEISKSARNRVVGEIYRELDTTLRSNRQLAQQVREAFRSGSLDAEHQRALVSLVAGRARQALPGVSKRVLNEWTSTIVAANQDRRARQRTAERRVDIAGSGRTGSDGPRPTTPRDIDYARMSDADILNL